jgi:hypothetical protein
VVAREGMGWWRGDTEGHTRDERAVEGPRLSMLEVIFSTHPTSLIIQMIMIHCHFVNSNSLDCNLQMIQSSTDEKPSSRFDMTRFGHACVQVL